MSRAKRITPIEIQSVTQDREGRSLAREDSGIGKDWAVLSDELPSMDVPMEILAHRLHNGFQKSALPSAIIIGVACVVLFTQDVVEAHTAGRVLATYCATMSVVMTSLLVYLHLTVYSDPLQQRRIVRILLMVPIYAVDSCIALWGHHLASLIGLARDGYESYVIYNFYHLLMGYLGGEEEALRARGGVKMKHLPPLCFLPPFQLNRATIRLWRLLLVQYMFLKPTAALVAIMLHFGGAYDETSWSFRDAHVYFVIILNISVTCAFTSLVYFFFEFKDLLMPIKPIGKFAAVKAVVFLSFWQGVLMGLLVHFGFIQPSKQGLWTKEEVATGVQDFLICIEMLFMCYVHHLVFSESPYVPSLGHQPVRSWVIRHVLSISDVIEDSVSAVANISTT